MKGRTFGRSGKLVASCTAFWNSSTDSPPLCNRHFYWHIGSITWKIQITANANTNDRSRSPTSALLSWPNCTSAPKNRLIFKSRWLSCANAELGRIPATEVCIDGGGVPSSVGDKLLCRLTLELLRSLGGMIELIELMWCGDIGDLGAMTRAPSGESGVWRSLPALEVIKIDQHSRQKNLLKLSYRKQRVFEGGSVPLLFEIFVFTTSSLFTGRQKPGAGKQFTLTKQFSLLKSQNWSYNCSGCEWQGK